MKNFAYPLFGYLLLTNMSFIMTLDLSSLETIGIKGNAVNDNFGWSVSSAGDIDNDGYDDLIIGAPYKNGNQGAAYVIYGEETSSPLPTFDLSSITLDPLTTGFMITGNAAHDQLGSSVSLAGDINNDGYDDIIIGAPYKNSNQGAAYVIYGGAKSTMNNINLSSAPLNSLSTGFMITGTAGGDRFGSSVSSAGDFNNDGYDDIIIGVPGKNSNQGAAYIIYGGPTSSMSNIILSSTPLIPQSTGFMVTGNAAGDQLGSSVSHAGDVNNDGYDDIIVGAPYKNGNQGAAYVIYGGQKSSMSDIVLSSTALNPGTAGFMITGESIDDYFGWSTNRAGDINNDGYDEVIIGAYGKNNNQGAVYVVYGGPKSTMSNWDFSSGATLDPTSTGFMITGSAAYGMFGFSVNCAGDINNNGYDEIIIGAHGESTSQGAAYVIYGGEKSIMTNINLASQILDPLTTGFMITGNAAQGFFGYSVSSAGDFNNDGFDDIIIGAYGESSKTGATYLVLNQCPDNCSTCSSPSVCTVCSQRYVLDGPNCSPCPGNCEICSSTASCVICTSSYLLYEEQCLSSCPSQTFETNGECQGCPNGETLIGSQCVKDTTKTEEIEEKDGERAAAGVFEGTSLAGAALGSGSSLPFNFGLVAKIIRNFKYMKLPVSQELYETFVSWKVASGFMSAPRSWSSKYNSKTIPMVFSRYGLQAAFMINFWKPFAMALIGMAVFAIFKAIEVSISKDKKSMVYTISRQVNVAASNFALTQFYSNLDDVIFYFILEMRSTGFESGFRACSSLLAIVLLVVGGIFIGLHSKLIGRYQGLKGKASSAQLKSFEAKCENISLIFKDFKDTNLIIQSFLMINVIRSVVASLVFATLFEYPMIQISLLLVLNIVMIVYLLAKKSFKEFANTCGQLFCELVLFIANICVFLLALFDHAEYYPVASIQRLGKCIIILNYILLFGCAIFLLFSLGKTLYQSYLERKKAQQVSPINNSIFASAKLKSSGSGLDLPQSNQSISTHNGMINESHSNLQSDSYANHLGTMSYNHENLDRDSHVRQRQGIPNNYSDQNRPRNQNSMESFDMANSNVVLQSNPAEDFDEDERINRRNLFSNVIPRSRLVRNREITAARIAQFSRMEDNSRNGSPEMRVQDPSRMGDQDVSLTNSDLGTGSPPLRGSDLMSRRRIDGV